MAAETIAEKKLPLKPFLASLTIISFSTGVSNSIVALLAVDIARTFFGTADSAAVASVSQLSTFNNAIEIFFAFLLSILAIRFRHKRLLLAGSLFVVVSALGSFFAPSLLVLQFLYALEGIGTIFVNIMGITLIGDMLPADKKPKAISYMNSAGAMATLVVIFLIGFIANIGGWRFDFLLIALPVSVVGLILAYIVIPSKGNEQPAISSTPNYLSNFKQVFTNKSATSFLVANILTIAGTQVALFAIAFYRTIFGLSRDWTTAIYVTSIVIFVVAPLIAGRLVNKFGAKRVGVTSCLLSAIFVMTFFFVSNVWGAVILDMCHVWFAATAILAFSCLIIDQVPKSRGTLLSLNSIFNNIGNVIAASLGGTLLFLTGAYGAVGLALGAITIVGVAIIFFFTKDPNRP